MALTETTIASAGFLIDGKWESPNRDLHNVVNPASGEVIAQVPYATLEEVDRAVKAAHNAFLEWRDVPVVDRVQPLYQFKDLLEKNSVELATMLSRENGKTLDDPKLKFPRHSDGRSRRRHAELDDGESLENVAKGIDSHSIRQPLGVCVGITPFNFPMHGPMWMYPFAIAAGNAFILKPSEKVPLTPTRACELLADAGLKPGVITLLHGGREAVDALLKHPLVRAVSFVGSTPIAKYIYATAAAEGKRVQALGGAKNHMVVMPDANIEKSAEAIMSSAFGAAGERCLAGSVLVPVGKAAEPILAALLERCKNLKVGDPVDASSGMGPVVTKEHREKIVGYIEKGVAEGAKPLCDGRRQNER